MTQQTQTPKDTFEMLILGMCCLGISLLLFANNFYLYGGISFICGLIQHIRTIVIELEAEFPTEEDKG